MAKTTVALGSVCRGSQATQPGSPAHLTFQPVATKQGSAHGARAAAADSGGRRR
jgi:hypothetical protein